MQDRQSKRTLSGLSSSSWRQGCCIIYCSCIAGLPPFTEEKVLPICSKATGIFCRAVLSVRVWDLFPQIPGVCSSRSLHCEAVLLPILQVLPLVKLFAYNLILCSFWRAERMAWVKWTAG